MFFFEILLRQTRLWLIWAVVKKRQAVISVYGCENASICDIDCVQCCFMSVSGVQ